MSILNKKIVHTSILLIFSCIFAIIVCEISLRIYFGKNVFELIDYQRSKTIPIDISGLSVYDEDIGWKLRPGIRTDGFNTLDHGIRRNSVAHERTREGGILVSGASFTAGSEVVDEFAWPAQLEQLTQISVDNVSAGGYALDQIVIRTEEMMPIIKPSIVIVDVSPGLIFASKYSVNGMPKPYFTLEDGELVKHNFPVPKYVKLKDRSFLRNFYRYSLIFDRAFATLFPKKYTLTPGAVDIGNDHIAVSCALFERLKKVTDKSNAKLGVVWQYGGGFMSQVKPKPIEATSVQDCLRANNIQFIDEYDRLRRLLEKKDKSFTSQYMPHPGGTFGHKSPKGNLDVAQDVMSLLERLNPTATEKHSLNK